VHYTQQTTGDKLNITIQKKKKKRKKKKTIIRCGIGTVAEFAGDDGSRIHA
jgi:hypothetical protein